MKTSRRATRSLALAAIFGSNAAFATLGCNDSDNSGTVTVRTPKAPAAVVVYRDGAAPWTTTTGASGSVRFASTSGVYTVVIACNTAKRNNVDVYAATTAELSTIDYQAECANETQIVSGSTTSASTAFLYFGQSGATLTSTSSYTLEAPRGNADLVAVAGSRVAIKRDIALGDSPVSVDIDLNLPAAADLRQHRFTLASIPEVDTNAYTALWTKGGTYAPLCSSNNPTGCGLPASALAPGDLHVLGVVSRGAGAYRHARWSAFEAADRQVDFPIMTLSPPTVSVSADQTNVAMSVTWPEAPSASVYRVIAAQLSGPPHRFWQLVASEGFVSRVGSMSFPDMVGVTGWNPGVDLVAGNFLEWSVLAEMGAPLEELVRWYPTHERTILAQGFEGSTTPQ